MSYEKLAECQPGWICAPLVNYSESDDDSEGLEKATENAEKACDDTDLAPMDKPGTVRGPVWNCIGTVCAHAWYHCWSCLPALNS